MIPVPIVLLLSASVAVGAVVASPAMHAPGSKAPSPRLAWAQVAPASLEQEQRSADDPPRGDPAGGAEVALIAGALKSPDAPCAEGDLRMYGAGAGSTSRSAEPPAAAPPSRWRLADARPTPAGEVPEATAPLEPEDAEDLLLLGVGSSPLDSDLRSGRGDADRTGAEDDRVDAVVGVRLPLGRVWVLRAQVRHEVTRLEGAQSGQRYSEVAIAVGRRF